MKNCKVRSRVVLSAAIPQKKNKRTVHMHQILLQTSKTCIKTYGMLKLAFRKETISRTQDIQVVFKVQECNYFCWRCWMFRAMFHNFSRNMQWEIVPQGKTVSKYFSTIIMQYIWQDVQHKCLEKWCTGDWFLHHGKASANSA